MIFYADILVVDDCSDHIALVSSILQKEGFHVCAATSGSATRAFFSKKLPDLVLLDIQMGDTSGLEVCRKLKESDRTKDIPIIFMTSEKASDIIAKCFSLGAADFIQKPFSKEEFLTRVHTQLKASIQRKEFQAAYEELSQFTSYVSHDLKAPLNIISSLTDGLNSSIKKSYGEDLPDDIKEILDVITSKSSQARLLIDRLLDFSRMCNVRPNAKRLDAQEITEEIFEDLMLLQDNNRDVDFKCENLSEIVADEKLFRMAMQNLLINALKYSSHREHTVIRVYPVKHPRYYVIKVKDNGAGFDMAYVGKIFEMFQRLHTDKEFPGTGVGLALVNRIMTRHRGKIEAYGEVDNGAEMTLYFPKYAKPIKNETL